MNHFAIKNLEKGGTMKKFLILVALLLIPSVCVAGTATSRWDLTVGGFIKAEFGYSDQQRAQNNIIPYREAVSGYDSYGAKYGTYFSSAIETRFNFLIKGPDVWGMKTQAFLEADFYNAALSGWSDDAWKRTYTLGNLRLRHANIRLDGPNASYLIGQASQIFGTAYGTGQTLLILTNWMGATTPVGGGRMPQINVEFAPTKEMKLLVGAFINDNILASTGTTSGDVDFYTMGTPYVQARMTYTTDKLGKIGGDQFTFILAGFYGKDRRVCTTATGACALPNPGAAYTTLYTDRLDSWGLSANLFVPVIPAKKEDKTGSVGFSIFAFAMQNPGDQGIPGNIFSGGSQTPYRRPDGSWASLVVKGWGPQAYMYLSDKVLFLAAYADTKANMSAWYMANNPNNLERRSAWVFLLNYDPNPALKFTLDWERDSVRYAGSATNLKKTGTMNVYRLSGFYFF